MASHKGVPISFLGVTGRRAQMPKEITSVFRKSSAEDGLRQIHPSSFFKRPYGYRSPSRIKLINHGLVESVAINFRLFHIHSHMSSSYIRPIVIDDTDSTIEYSGQGWFQDSGDGPGNFGAGPYLHTRHGTNSNDSFSFSFTGESSSLRLSLLYR